MKFNSIKEMFFNGKSCGLAYFNGKIIWGAENTIPSDDKNTYFWYDEDGITLLDQNDIGIYSQSLPTKSQELNIKAQWFSKGTLFDEQEQYKTYAFKEWIENGANSYKATYTESLTPQELICTDIPTYSNPDKRYIDYIFDKWEYLRDDFNLVQYDAIYTEDVFKSLLLYVGNAYSATNTGYPYSDEDIQTIATELGTSRLVINCNAFVARWTFHGTSPFTLSDINSSSWEVYCGATNPATLRSIERLRFQNPNTAVDCGDGLGTRSFPLRDVYSEYLPYALELTRKLLRINNKLKIWWTLPIGIDYFTCFADKSEPFFEDLYLFIKTNYTDVWDNIEGFYYGCEGGFSYWCNNYVSNRGDRSNSSYVCMSNFRSFLRQQGDGKKLMCIPYLESGTAGTNNRNRVLDLSKSNVFDFVFAPASYNFNWNTDSLRSNYSWIRDTVTNSSNQLGYQVEWDGSSTVSINKYNETIQYMRNCIGYGPMIMYIGARSGNDCVTDINVYKNFCNL